MTGAKIALLRAQAKLLEHEYERRSDELVPAAAAEAAIRKIVQYDRDSWRAIPRRYAAEFAREFGVDEALALSVLERLIDKQLSELPEIEVDLSDDEAKRRGGRPYGRLGVTFRV